MRNQVTNDLRIDQMRGRYVVVRGDNSSLRFTPPPAFRELTGAGTRNTATEQDGLSTFIE